MMGDPKLQNTPVGSEPTPRERSAAVRAVAAHAHDRDDLIQLLSMLGLSAREAREQLGVPEGPARRDTEGRRAADELAVTLTSMYRHAG